MDKLKTNVLKIIDRMFYCTSYFVLPNNNKKLINYFTK